MAGRGALLVVVGVAFLTGFFAGYKTKEWRLKFLKRRRDRLADKLVETQRQIDFALRQ